MADAVNVKKMKVVELKKELALHDLDTKGHKSELQARLTEFLQQQGLELDPNDDAEEDAEEDGDDDLVNVTAGDDEEEIVDDVLADESFEQKLEEPDKVKPIEENVTETQEPKVDNEQQNGAITNPFMKTVSPKADTVATTEEERKLQRMKRFGSPANEADKKSIRAQRFGTNTGSNISSPEITDLSKLKKRAERFGAVSPLVTKVEEQGRLLKRKERFGASLTATDESVEARKKKRLERFSS